MSRAVAKIAVLPTPLNNGQETGHRRDIATRFQPGNALGRGRPPGSRNKLSEDFLRDAHEAWCEDGRAAFQKLATDEPAKFDAKAAAPYVHPKLSAIDANVSLRPTHEDVLDELDWLERLANGPQVAGTA